ncbi:MAG: hypothetical protein ACLUIX_08195 [Oscillospiraceae bacterium]
MLKLEGLKLAPEEKEAALHRRAARLRASRRRTCCRCRCAPLHRRTGGAASGVHRGGGGAAGEAGARRRGIGGSAASPGGGTLCRRCCLRRRCRRWWWAPGRVALFAALVLARCGLRPILLERGRDTTARQRDVETFWRTGVLDPESNVQFGEGEPEPSPTGS